MRDDRWPRSAVDIDTERNAEEMEVSLSIRELRELWHLNPTKHLDRVEPWVRVRMADDWEVSFGVEMVYREDDGA